MRVLKLFALAIFAAALVTSQVITRTVNSQSGPTEAPAAFDNMTNGFIPLQADFEIARAAFDEREEIADGLGPVYNAQACGECHQNPVSGGITQIFELRAGHIGPNGTFVDPPGGSLIQARAINAQIQERVPDGPRIAFMAGTGNLAVMGFDGGQYGQLGNTPVRGSYPSFNPDGTKLVFAAVDPSGSTDIPNNIFVVNSDGTGLTQLTTSGQDTQPDWSPDGLKIAFSSTRTGKAQIFSMNPDGSGQTNLSNITSANDTEPSWSPDSTGIVFVRSFTRGLNPTPDLWVMKSSGGGQSQLTFTPSASEGRPDWSPDGGEIAFHTNIDGNQEIYKMASDGSGMIRLTNNAAIDINPAWAPDAKAIAFSSTRVIGGPTIWSIETDGVLPTRLSTTTGDLPTYSKDAGEDIRTFRASLNVLGDGFVEATDDATFLAIRTAQPPLMRGTAIFNAGLESPGEPRFSRFSWKGSVPTLLSFSAGAYLLEMGITSPLQPKESTSLGRSVTAFDTVADPEDTGGPMNFGEDVEKFTSFMRSTKAPPRDRLLVPDDAIDPGSALFDSLSCSVCHTRSITTTPNPATTFNNGTFTVGPALANKVYHPFGDFLLHDIGTGDGIVETNGEVTRNKVRTAPLWGLRTRERLMHDGGSSSPPSNSGAQSFTMNEVILRHAGQATASRTGFLALTTNQRVQLFKFLKSL